MCSARSDLLFHVKHRNLGGRVRILPARKALYSVQRRPQRRPSATHTAGPPDPAGRVTNPRPVRPNGPPRSLIDRGAFAVALILTPVSRETQEPRRSCAEPARAPNPAQTEAQTAAPSSRPHTAGPPDPAGELRTLGPSDRTGPQALDRSRGVRCGARPDPCFT
jgi:hypothetical protein